MPVPKLGQVLIKIEYTALNRADVMQVFIVQIKRFCRETGLTLHLQVPQRSLVLNVWATSLMTLRKT